MSEHPARVKCSIEIEAGGEKGFGSSERVYPASTDPTITETDGVDIDLLALPIVHALRACEAQVVSILASALMQALRPNLLDGDVSLKASLLEEEATLLAALVEYRAKAVEREMSEV